MKSPTDNKRRYLLSFAFMLLLIGATFYYIFKDDPIRLVLPVIKQVNFNFIIGGLLAVFFYECLEATNIRMILKSLGHSIKFKTGLKYALIGFFFGSITPSSSGAQPAQVYYMKKDDIDISVSSLTLLIIVGIYHFVMLFYAILSFFLSAELVGAQLKKIGILLVYGIGFNALSIIIIFMAVFSQKMVRRLVCGCTGFLERIKLIKNKENAEKKVEEQLEEYQIGAQHLKKNPVVFARAFIINFTEMTFMLSVPYFVYKAFGLHDYSYLDILAVQAILNIAVVALPVPGAVGAAESSFLVVFRTFFGAQLLIPGMLLSRGISFYFYLILSGIVVLTTNFINMRRNTNSSLKTRPVR